MSAGPSGVGGYDKQLNEASPYYDLGLQKITSPGGVFYYMCTRNNNFSNRDQKGQIVVYASQFFEEFFDSLGGLVQLNSNSISIPAGLIRDLAKVRVSEKTAADLRSARASRSFATQSLDESKLGSNFIQIEIKELNVPSMPDLELDKPIKVSLKLTRSSGAMESVLVYRLSGDYATMSKVASESTESRDGRVDFETRLASGVYVVQFEKDYTPLAVSLVVLGVLGIVVASVAVYLCRNGKYLRSMRYKSANWKRSLEMEL